MRPIRTAYTYICTYMCTYIRIRTYVRTPVDCVGKQRQQRTEAARAPKNMNLYERMLLIVSAYFNGKKINYDRN